MCLAWALHHNGRCGPLRRSNLRRRSYVPLLRKAGLPYRTLHALRHTAATLMLEQEVPVHVVAGLLGHARASITLDIYASYVQTAGRDAVTKLDALFGQPTDSQTDTHRRTMADGGGRGGNGATPVVVPIPDVRGQSRTAVH